MISGSRPVTVSVDVDVYLDDIDTDDLIEELESRGVQTDSGASVEEELRAMYDKYVLGKPIDEELRQLFWKVLGRMV